METVQPQIKLEINEFERGAPKYNPSFASTTKDVIELIDLYWASRFKGSDKDSLGVRKVFYSIVDNPVWVSMKMTDIDTKNIKLVPDRSGEEFLVWLLSKELKVWMKDNKFDKFLNDVNYSWNKYGTAFAKKVRDKVFMVPVQNLMYDPKAESLDKSSFIIEKIMMTPDELREHKEWKNIESVIEANKDEPNIVIYERFGLAKDTKDTHFILAKASGDTATLLYSDKLDQPYKQLSFDKYPERLFGVGQVEKLFEAQIHLNKVQNYKAKGLHWTSKHIYQSRDNGLDRNLMTDVDDGEILRVNSEIQPIVNEERNLHSYREEEEVWNSNIEKRTFAYDVMRGERSPAGTPLGSSILQSQMAGGFFELKREEFGIFIKDIIEEWVLPAFKKAKSPEHIFNFVGNSDDLEKIDKLLAGIGARKSLIKYITSTGRVPSRTEFGMMEALAKEALSGKSSREFKLPRGAYSDLKYKVDVVITGESVDVQGKITAIQVALQNTQDPAEARKLTRKMMETLGFAEEYITGEPTQSVNEVAQAQGSQPRLPNSQGTPQLSQTEQTI